MNHTDKIKVLLVDDHILLRDGVAMLLKQADDIQIVGSLATGEEAISKVSALLPDVIIMDIHLTGMTGIEATRWIKERNPRIKVILLSREVSKEFVSSGIQAGIDGYLPKDVEKGMLISAIRSVFQGGKAFDNAITNLVFEDYYKKEKGVQSARNVSKMVDLTNRERQILSLVANGKSNTEVADELFISTKTVDTHKTHILEKLGLKNTAELVKYAIKNKLITVD
ncbi:MAG TPA: response regulator transcription factor [Cyclobacteriaceae bacterium]|nr:response regulator transcription factor [Cyclobacteriaceae bacterium]